MISQEQVKYLLNLPKELEHKENKIDFFKQKNQFILISPDDDEWKFLLSIFYGKKRVLKYQFIIKKIFIILL